MSELSTCKGGRLSWMAQRCLRQLSAPPPPRAAHLLFRHLRTPIAFSLLVLRVPLGKHGFRTTRHCDLLHGRPLVPLPSVPRQPLEMAVGTAVLAGLLDRKVRGREAGWQILSQCPGPWRQPWSTQETRPPPVRESHPITQRSGLSEESVASTEPRERNS